MLERKLKALGFMGWDKLDLNDAQHFRKVVIWLEDQKIRLYKIDDRKELRNTESDNWPKAFQKYCQDIECPTYDHNLDKLEWFIGRAIWLEYSDGYEKYHGVTGNKCKDPKESAKPSVKCVNPLDNLDFNSNEFKEGVKSLAKLLKVPQHPDHIITLEACSKLVEKRLNPEVLANPNSFIVKGQPFPIMETNSGFKMGDKVLDNAIKVLNLLYIQDLRNLQTEINEIIVAVQSVTANPKTDTKLGKVGI